MSIRYWLFAWNGTLVCEFRRGAVPGTACRKPSPRGYFRRFHTAPEIRENEFIADGCDPDCTEHRIRVRAKRTHGNDRGGLPHVFDDLPVGRRGDSWKHYRHHQSRRRGIESAHGDAGRAEQSHRRRAGAADVRTSQSPDQAGRRAAGMSTGAMP